MATSGRYGIDADGADSRPGVAQEPRVRLWAGVRGSIAAAVAVSVLGVSFGALSDQAHLSPALAIVMSAVVFSGTAQFAAIAIVAAGGGIVAALVGATLMNSRYLPMGIALAPSLPGGPLRRGLQGQAVVDAAWALAARGDGSFDRWILFGSSATQYVAWVGGTAIGALGGGALPSASALGLDAAYPAFFLALLLGEISSRRALAAALLGAAIAIALVPVVPPGIPVLAASLAALFGLGAAVEKRG